MAFIGLIFRTTIYWQIPVRPVEPAWFGDLIELLIYFTILGLSGLSIIFSIIVAILKNYRTAIGVFLVGIITPLAYYFLYSIACTQLYKQLSSRLF